MKQSDDKDYLYASGRIRALEGKLLNRERARRMIESRTAEEAFRVLADCGYETPPLHTPEELDRLLVQEQRRFFDMISDMIPDQKVIDVFRVRYDIHNVKVLLKSSASGGEIPDILLEVGRISPSRLIPLVREMTLKELPPLLARAITEARDVLARTGDPQLMEITLDKAGLREMLKLAQETGDPFLIGYVRLMIDAANLRALVRLKRMGKGMSLLNQSLAEGGNISPKQLVSDSSDSALETVFAPSLLKEAASAGAAALRHGTSLTEMDRRCDNALLAYLRSAKAMAFGLPLVAAYLAAKEMEVTALRMILSGRLAHVPPEIIRERTRDYYV